MSLPDPNSRNGYSPRPGVVHRPTRSTLPPLVGTAADDRPVHGPRAHHWTDSPVGRENGSQTTGSHVPELHPDLHTRAWTALFTHGHLHDSHPHVLDIGENGELTFVDGLHPAVKQRVELLIHRVCPEWSRHA